MSVKGIDVSSYQGTINWSTVKASGIQIAVFRSVLKSGTTDTKFEANYTGAGNAGIKRGIYIFSYALTVDAAGEEANKVIRLLAGRKLELPVYYDLEWSEQRNKCSKVTLTKMVRAFESIITAAGYQFGIYCNLDWYKNVLDTSSLKYDYWIARYPSSDNGTVKDSLKPNVGEVAWQYSSKGNVPGISGAVDMNLFYKDYSDSDLSGTEAEIPVADGEEDYTYRIQRAVNIYYGAGLAEDNKLGAKTKAALPVVKKDMRGEMVKLLQQGLIFMGFDCGPDGADGVFGGGTEASVIEFQKVYGLVKDGIVGINTWSTLITLVMEA